jgi:hypothetical protein
MTPADLQAWQGKMGLTAPKAAAALGVSYATYRDWLAGTSRNTGKPVQISLAVALACSALAAGLDGDSWREPDHPLPW